MDGQPRYEVIGKTTGKARAVTIRDAREGNWLPSVTTILKILHKEALVNWLIEQSVLACLTTPKKPDEALDAFIERVLHVERVQDEEGAIARDKGTEIHSAMEDYFLGMSEMIPEDLKPWIVPAAEAVAAYGTLVASEKILVGEGYAGKTDLILEGPECWWIWDYKTTKKLPDPAKGGAWSEHRLQLSAYAQAYADLLTPTGATKLIRTANVYISTIEQGKFVICEHPSNWLTTYNEGFAPLVTHWQWANRYRPAMPATAKPAEVPPAAAPEAPKAQPTASQVEAPKPAPRKNVVWTPAIAAKRPLA